MVRISGVNIPDNKPVWVALTYIYGIGRTRSLQTLEATGVNPQKRTKDLTPEEINKIQTYIEEHFKIEGDLRREIAQNIKRLIEIGCYRGLRHKRGLPVRGQRTRTNARTRKGPRPRIGGIKKKKG